MKKKIVLIVILLVVVGIGAGVVLNLETIKGLVGGLGGSKEKETLVAYFTRAHNTDLNNIDSLDLDAVSSASILEEGNVGIIATWIEEYTGADMFSIQAEEYYPSDYSQIIKHTENEKKQNARPDLASTVPDLEKYDRVFLGYPNWWESCPMAVLAFIEENDLTGKEIILFSTHGTGGLGKSVSEIQAVLPEDCTLNENVLAIPREDLENSKETVTLWLQEVVGEKE
ncbi:MAG: flavodoxin [Anaerotignaceae bacterium]